jgi:hypothetical protein
VRINEELLGRRFEGFTAVTMKNGVFWDVTPCGSCKNRHSSETSVLTRGARRNIPEDTILLGRNT